MSKVRASPSCAIGTSRLMRAERGDALGRIERSGSPALGWRSKPRENGLTKNSWRAVEPGVTSPVRSAPICAWQTPPYVASITTTTRSVGLTSISLAAPASETELEHGRLATPSRAALGRVCSSQPDNNSQNSAQLLSVLVAELPEISQHEPTLDGGDDRLHH